MILDTRLGNTPRWYLSPPRDFDMRVPDEIRQCVVYLGLTVTKPDGQIVMRPKGTAFFVTVDSEMHGDVAYSYLVTANHVARALEGKRFTLRVNQVDGGSQFVQGGEDTQWWTHPTDDGVDVAIIAWAPPDTVEHKTIPTSMFLTEEVIREKKIGTGDEVFIAGLFIHLAGTARNIPIVRMGNIAMMPDETVPTKDLGRIEAYLIEARSIGGLSGSPAFVRETIPMGLGGFYLMGLMHGHWDIPPEARDDQVAKDDTEALGTVNMGIAVVVPAKKILEVLNQPRLVQIRTDRDEAIRKERAPTLDEALEEKEGLTKEQS